MSIAADVLYQREVKYRNSKIEKDGSFSFSAPPSELEGLRCEFEERSVCATYSDITGLPRIIRFLCRRPGILAGIIVFIITMWISGRVVWGFTVNGNDNVSENEILEALSEQGCDYGSYIPGIDFDSLQAFFLAGSKDIAWLSVNMKGNRAFVEVIESKHIEESGAGEKYANLVASEDGRVSLVLPSSGSPEISQGDIVKKGDILISGVVHTRDAVLEDKVRYEYASGSVLAYVNKSVSVKIPFESEKKVFTGEKYEENRVKIFKKNINLFSKGRIEYTTYDKIEEAEQVSLFGWIKLPVWNCRTTYREYENVPVNIDSGEAAALAAAELRERMDEELEGCELTSKKITTEYEDDGIVIRCDMTCLADIAETKEFYAE